VHPGYIDTPMIAPRLSDAIGNMTGRQWLETLHPLGRLGRAEEVADMILFLLSDESTFSTGSEFVCDGGLTA
jgi:NAD(P)-dependent dehydrogenase (short-subunit alcohol dehydrogenase family)